MSEGYCGLWVVVDRLRQSQSLVLVVIVDAPKVHSTKGEINKRGTLNRDRIFPLFKI